MVIMLFKTVLPCSDVDLIVLLVQRCWAPMRRSMRHILPIVPDNEYFPGATLISCTGSGPFTQLMENTNPLLRNGHPGVLQDMSCIVNHSLEHISIIGIR